MTFRRDLARVLPWALLAYAALSLTIALWLVIARWAIVASDYSTWRALAFLMAANLFFSALVVPGKDVAKVVSSGLFRLRPESLRAIRRAIRLTRNACRVGTVTLVVGHVASSGLLSPPAARIMTLIIAFFFLVCLPLLMAAVAVAGRDAVRTPPAGSLASFLDRLRAAELAGEGRCVVR